jgi:steroid delta-isomerase-like uncharacterized protein
MSDVVDRQRALVAEHIGFENNQDWAGVCTTFVQDDRAYYDVVPLGTRFQGIEGVRGFYQAIGHALPDLHIEVVSEVHVPGTSILEVVITGTQRGEFAGIKPLGNPVRIEMAAFYIFNADSDKLIAERIYYDQASVVQQMLGKQQSAVA